MEDAGNRSCALAHAMDVQIVSGDGWSSVEAELRYDSRDPFAATLVFLLADHQISWTLGRELIAEGLHRPTGDGDVHVRPGLDHHGHACVLIELSSPQGRALVQASSRDVREFVERMTATVRPGTELLHVDIDGAIEAVLASASTE